MSEGYNDQCELLSELIKNIDGEKKEMIKEFEEWWMYRNDGVDREKYPNALPPKTARNVEKMIDSSGKEITMAGIDNMKVQLVQNILTGSRLKSGDDAKKMKVKSMQEMIDAIGWAVFPGEWTLSQGEMIGYKE